MCVYVRVYVYVRTYGMWIGMYKSASLMRMHRRSCMYVRVYVRMYM